jgi:hypothetical protein
MILRKLRLLCAFILAALFICGIAADVMRCDAGRTRNELFSADLLTRMPPQEG